MNILVTGSAGFIGFHISNLLLKKGINVFGIDNINDYYDRDIKFKRIELLSNYQNFTFEKIDISDHSLMESKFENESFDMVIHLAAQAGVRYSIENPFSYAESNLLGFTNILEICRNISNKKNNLRKY